MATEQTQEQQEPAIQSTMSAAPKQLAATDITSKIATGTPLMQGEKLPDVPEGISAKGFYGQFPGGASVYSQAPFAQSSFKSSVPSTPVSTPKTEEPTSSVLPEPAVDTPVIQDEGDSQEPSLELADTPDVSNQMNDLLGNVDLGYSFEFDPDLSFVEDLSKNFEEFSVSFLEDTGIDLSSLDITLSNIGDRLGTAYNEGITELKQETNEVLTDIEDFMGKGLEAHITDAMSSVKNSFQELADNLSNLTDPDKAMEAIGYFGSAFGKTIASNIIGKSLSAAGLGVLGGPLGIGIVSLASAGSQIGVVGMSYGFDSAHEGSVAGTGTASAIAGYNNLGVAVNKSGEPVYSYNPVARDYIDLQFKGPSSFGKDITDEALKNAAPEFVAEYIALNYSDPAYEGEEEPPSPMDYSQMFGGSTSIGLQDETPSADDRDGTTTPSDKQFSATSFGIIDDNGRVDSHLVTDIAKNHVDVVSLEQLHGMLATLQDPNITVSPLFSGISSGKSAEELAEVNKEAIEAVREAIAEKLSKISKTLTPVPSYPKAGLYGGEGGSLLGGDASVGGTGAAGHTTTGFGEMHGSEFGGGSGTTEDAAAAAQSAMDNMQGVGPGEGSEGGGAGGEAGDDSGKIICTMMNRMYGLGEYRIKQWLLYSDRYLTPEHQLGYHKLYCKPVSMMPTHPFIAKTLSHLAKRRTDDIVAEMKNTKRSWLGRVYRTLLIDNPSYIVGLMIKRNWLQPADISILSKGSI
tara:strand:- start:38475 stop:40706 length:2232 start_codon:yes stop_codon:yes gene_type:complete